MVTFWERAARLLGPYVLVVICLFELCSVLATGAGFGVGSSGSWSLLALQENNMIHVLRYKRRQLICFLRCTPVVFIHTFIERGNQQSILNGL